VAAHPLCRSDPSAAVDVCSAGAACLQPRLPDGELLWKVCYQRGSEAPPHAQWAGRQASNPVGDPDPQDGMAVGRGLRQGSAELVHAREAGQQAPDLKESPNRTESGNSTERGCPSFLVFAGSAAALAGGVQARSFLALPSVQCLCSKKLRVYATRSATHGDKPLSLAQIWLPLAWPSMLCLTWVRLPYSCL